MYFGEGGEITEERRKEIIDKIAGYIMKYGMETPAILSLETFKPLSYLGSQFFLLFAAPFIAPFTTAPFDYAQFFEKKENVEALIKRIEELAKESDEKKKEKKKMKESSGSEGGFLNRLKSYFR